MGLLLLVFEVLASPALTAAALPAPQKQHSLTIVSSEHLQIVRSDGTEWYEQGIWPLVGAVGALILTNAVAVRIVYLQSAKSFNAILRQRKIELLSTSLNEFYNPLLALIDVNKEIFTKTGPPSFPKEEIARGASALVWGEMKQKVLANNQQIEAILKTKTHLIRGTDSLKAYHALMIHVAMYEAFQKVETDLYSKFLFPSDIRKHIVEKRAEVLTAFNELTGEQI